LFGGRQKLQGYGTMAHIGQYTLCS
jgi:hypothetical protein